MAPIPRIAGVTLRISLLIYASVLSGCGEEKASPAETGLHLVAVTFNTGTNQSLPHDALPDDGYTSTQADVSDQWYGDGLAWQAVIDDTRRFFAEVDADVVAFQEIFYSGDCPSIPTALHPGWACEGWQPGAPTVAQVIVGGGYQVACHLGKPDKCIAVKRSFGTLRGCASDLCLDGLAGARVPDCGGGSRVGRGIIDLVSGGSLTVVNIHGTSGFARADVVCRTAQFHQVFVDLGLGDGEPAANGERNLILGDLNTDPGRAADRDPSARAFTTDVELGDRFHFVSPIGPEAIPTYAGIFNIDHVLSDSLTGECSVPGLDLQPPVTSVTYFDHKPLVCELREPPAHLIE